MPEAHLIEHLHVEVGFAGSLSAAEAEERLAAFAQGPALRIIDELFDEACGPDEVWRVDELALDLGEVAADEMETRWEIRLRERLRDALADLRGPGGATAGARGAGVVRGRPQAQLEALLFFLQHGRLPWHGRGDDPAALARSVLQHSAAAFAAALRGLDDRPRLLRRLATQLEADALRELVHALMPGEPAAAARLLGAVAQAARYGRTQDGNTALWEAVLEQALAHGAAPRPAAVQLLRAQLLAALDAGSAFSAASDPLLGVAHAWEPLLREDRAWLKATLQRLGDATALQQRIVHALPEALLPQVLGLWLASHLSTAVGEWIATVAAGVPASAQETGERRQALWQATLQHVLSGGAEQFDALRYADSVRSHLAAASPQSAAAPLRWFDRVAKVATSALAAAAAALRLPWRTRKAEAPEPAMAERLPVGNAGLVLTAPYMPRLFTMLGLADERAFASPEAAQRAALLLQFMVTGRAEAPEPALLLNKLLCGLDIAAPLPREIEIGDTERAAVEGLLQAVIQHWKVLGRTSVAGLRETFLQREGHLERQPEAWQLQVEPRAFDMLIDQLPWGYSTIRHPWMERVVHVDWR